MRLRLIKSRAFSQSSDIPADIKNGWCAGVTAMVGKAVGDWGIESGLPAGRWVEENAYWAVEKVLDGIGSHLKTTETLQAYLRRLEQSGDVCADIHRDEFNGRGCKVVMSSCEWIPALGYLSYLRSRTWNSNHIGFLVRGGNRLLLMDPNYGVGVFDVDDTALQLNDVTAAIGDLAWANSMAHYFLTSTRATAVIDEG
jgi:hypothetical protein